MARGRSFSRTDAEMSRVVKAGQDLNGPALQRLCRKEKISLATWYNWARRVNGTQITTKSGATVTVINLAEMEARNKELADILTKAIKLKKEEQELQERLRKLQ